MYWTKNYFIDILDPREMEDILRISDSYGLVTHGSETCSTDPAVWWSDTRDKYKLQGQPMKELKYIYSGFYGNNWSK